MAVIGAEPCSKDEIQDKLEIVFDKMFGDTSSELYAARHVIIDDMYGLEVLGGNDTDDAKYDIFYGLYLTDGKESYVITGFGDDEVEFVFEKLTGASRLFNRKSEPALISKGKSNDKEIKAVRKLASKLYIDFEMDWQILNCTFSVHDGRLDTGRETSFLMLSEKGVEEMDFVEIYNEDKTFNEEISDLLSTIHAYDISGFTVTLFKDGRYGITYYPVEEDEFNEEDDHDHNHDHCHHEHYYDDEENDYFPEHGSEKEYALNYMNKLHADILSPVEKWDNGMVIIQNTENFTMVYPYYNTGSNPFIEVNIIEETPKEKSDVYRITVDGESFTVRLNGAQAEVNGTTYDVSVSDSIEPAKEKAEAPRATGSVSVITAGTPGLVTQIPIKEGDRISAGQNLCVLEVMKMETFIRAGRPGTVTRILVQKGEQVKTGQPVLEVAYDQA